MNATALEPSVLRGNGDLPYSLLIELTVTDAEVIAELCMKCEGRERDDYALSALRLGVLALKQARGQVDAQALKREGELLLKDVAQALVEHRTYLDGTLSKTLQDYFDPTSGRFNERLERLLKKDGELESLLARKVTAADSELSRALAAHFGKDSPIFRLLSPNEAEGVLAALRNCVNLELKSQRDTVLREFSLDNKEGALSRLAGQLCDSNGKLQGNLQEKIDGLLKQFSFDDEQSALSRMSRAVADTNRAISSHLTLDDEKSALSRLKRELFGMIKEQSEAAQKFQEDVRVTLQRLEVRKTERAASTTHGLDFESNVFGVVSSEAQRLGDVASHVASHVGLISGCKIGDIVVELGPESTSPGAKIVVEAKEKKVYTLAEARAEIEKGRDNRAADAGLFVFSKKSAPLGLEPLTRYGQDVFVVWDAEDTASDLQLKLGLSVARALCIHKASKRVSESADFEEMDRALLEIGKQIDELDKIRRWAETIQNNSKEILERVRISSKKLRDQIDTLTQRLSDLRHLAAT